MRDVLANSEIDPAALSQIENFHSDAVGEVKAALQKNQIVIVGMAQNPFVKKARELLNSQKVEFTYLEYGNYISKWKIRLAIKLWSGWPTFPQIFIDKKLIGGFKDLERLSESGRFRQGRSIDL